MIGTSSAFGTELKVMRRAKGWSLATLSERMHYSPGYLSKVESGKRPPTVGLARTADVVLGTDGDLEQLARNERAHSTLPARPAQLPPGVANFVGRDPEFSMLDSLIALPEPGVAKLAVIHGPPGAGKTALAVRWGQRVSAHFPDGIFISTFAVWMAMKRSARMTSSGGSSWRWESGSRISPN